VTQRWLQETGCPKALLSPTEALETATAAAKMSQNVAEQSMLDQFLPMPSLVQCAHDGVSVR
jgi:hypothetical protein